MSFGYVSHLSFFFLIFLKVYFLFIFCFPYPQHYFKYCTVSLIVYPLDVCVNFGVFLNMFVPYLFTWCQSTIFIQDSDYDPTYPVGFGGLEAVYRAAIDGVT